MSKHSREATIAGRFHDGYCQSNKGPETMMMAAPITAATFIYRRPAALCSLLESVELPDELPLPFFPVVPTAPAVVVLEPVRFNKAAYPRSLRGWLQKNVGSVTYLDPSFVDRNIAYVLFVSPTAEATDATRG